MPPERNTEVGHWRAIAVVVGLVLTCVGAGTTGFVFGWITGLPLVVLGGCLTVCAIWPGNTLGWLLVALGLLSLPIALLIATSSLWGSLRELTRASAHSGVWSLAGAIDWTRFAPLSFLSIVPAVLIAAGISFGACKRSLGPLSIGLLVSATGPLTTLLYVCLTARGWPLSA